MKLSFGWKISLDITIAMQKKKSSSMRILSSQLGSVEELVDWNGIIPCWREPFKKKKNVARNSDFSCNPFHDQCHDIYSRNEAKGSEKAHFEIIIIIFF